MSFYIYTSLFFFVFGQTLFLFHDVIMRSYIMVAYSFEKVVSFQKVGTVALNFSHYLPGSGPRADVQ